MTMQLFSKEISYGFVIDVNKSYFLLEIVRIILSIDLSQDYFLVDVYQDFFYPYR